MTVEILILLALLAVAVVLFATEVVAVDVAAVVLLVGLYAGGLIGADAVAAGFGDQVLLLLGSLFVLTEALVRTGALGRLEGLVIDQAERHPDRPLLVMVVAIGAVSAFLSNTATMAAFLPVAVGLARRLDLAPSKLLMPLAFGSILGGTCTLIGTSTNMVVSSYLPTAGLPRLGFFELAPVGLPMLVLGTLYLVTFGRRLLPAHRESALESYAVRSYLGEAEVPTGSPWVGRTLAETGAGRDLDLTVLGRLGEAGRVEPMAPDRRLEAGDLLVIKASQASWLRLKHRRELRLANDPGERAEPRTPRVAAAGDDGGEGREGSDRVEVHELLLAPRSRLAGGSLERLQFRTRYNLSVLAIYRRGGALRRRVSQVPLADGDVMLVQGDLTRLQWLIRNGDVIPLERFEVSRRRPRAWLAVTAFAGMIVAGVLGLAPFAITALVAALVVVLGGCLTSAEAYGAIEWRILVLVAALLALAGAMETSGTAEYLAAAITGASAGLPPVVLLAGFYLLTMLLTQPMSNQAAALVVLPVALETAADLGLEPRAFAITVCLAASASFITPLEPACLLVYGPGRYRFGDYFRVGLPLTVLVFVLTLVLVPIFWPLVPPASGALDGSAVAAAAAVVGGD